MNIKIETNLSEKEIIKILSENTFPHSPVLNSGHIKKLSTDKKLCGEIGENSFFVWKTLNKKAVIVPVLIGKIENGFICAKAVLPLHNKYMLAFWYALTSLYCVFNILYIPFSVNELLYFLNILVGLTVIAVSGFSVRKIFVKRAENTVKIFKSLMR